MGRMVANNQRVTLMAPIIAKFNEVVGSDFAQNDADSYKKLTDYIISNYELPPTYARNVMYKNKTPELLVEFVGNSGFSETKFSKKNIWYTTTLRIKTNGWQNDRPLST